MENPPNNAVPEYKKHDIGDPGSDMTRDIQVALSKEEVFSLPKVQSLPQIATDPMYEDIGKAGDLAIPGGFRRGHVLQAATTTTDGADNGISSHVHIPFMTLVTPPPPSSVFASLAETYSDFIFANFELSGSDLAEDDLMVGPTPASPLIRKKNRSTSIDKKGSNLNKTIFTILKAFVGSGVLFLPKGFENGGMAFSIVVLFTAAALSTMCMLRLTDCARSVEHSRQNISYGTLGSIAYGKVGRVAVNISLVLSQLGFCCSYLIFIERNVRDVIVHLTDCRFIPSPWWLILLQIPIYTPLSFVRKLKYFALTNLFADAMLLFGLGYILCYASEHIASAEAGTDWKNFNSQSWGLFLGTAVYCFEGIGLVLPIYESMDVSVRHKFTGVLSKTILGLVCFFSLFSSIVYAAFGSDVQSVVTLNLPNEGIQAGTISVQIAYCLALLLTYPLMLYPALMILESFFFKFVVRSTPPPNGQRGTMRLQKNVFRFLLVTLTATISIACMNSLDNFVSLIGGFCSVPLAFIYPCMFHNKLVKTSLVLNTCIIIVGVLIMAFSSYQALSTWNDEVVHASYCAVRAAKLQSSMAL